MLRSALFATSAFCYLAWAASLGVRSSAEDLGAEIPELRALPRLSARLAPIVIRRDPFRAERSQLSIASAGDVDGDPATDPPRPSAEGDAPSPADDHVPDIAGDVPGDPPAAHADATEAILKATIVGDRAVGYVQVGSTLQIVRVGDVVGARRITRIAPSALSFDDGSRLELGSGPAGPAPRSAAPAPTPARAVTLDDLRRAVRQLRIRQAPPPTFASPAGAPLPTTAGYPTPGPLPTVDERGYPAGSTPPAEATAPTPYPVPGIDR